MDTTLISSTVSSNPFIRVYPFGRILSEKFNTKIVGPVNSNGIYEPLKNEKWNLQTVRERNFFPIYLKTCYDIYKKIDGDVIHAFKPKIYSFGLALIAKKLKNKKVILDIDDWESQYVLDNYFSYNIFDIIKFALVDFYMPESYFSKKFLEKIRGNANHLIVDALCLQKMFGGTYIPSGADTDLFDPEKYKGSGVRSKYGIEKGDILVSFIGTPRKHKGILELISAFKQAKKENESIKLMIVGASKDNNFSQELKKIDDIIVEDYKAHAEIPKYISASDIVAMPLGKNPSTMTQMPYKIYEMMAMGKAIIATNVSDIPTALEGCGKILNSNKAEQIKECILDYAENKSLRNMHGRKAREKCIQNFSFNILRKRLYEIYEGL